LGTPCRSWKTVFEDDYKNRLKAGASKRQVPVHPKLIELGFLSFVEQRKNEIRLFYGLIEKAKRLPNVPLRWFNQSLRIEVGITNEDMKVRKDFHSFRHTAIDELKLARVELHVIKSIVGHSMKLGNGSDHDITDDTYVSDYGASRKLSAIKTLDYSSILANVQPWTGHFTK
jgi:integrase